VQLTYPFDSCSNAIPVLNGVIVIDYDRGTWHLEDHDPKFRFTYKLPIVFDELADPGPLDEVFRDWVSEEDVPLLYQLPAQALLQIQGNDFKKAYLIVGEKNTGKTTYAVYLLTAFFGAEFIARVPLQDLAMDRFSLADLEGMILNVYDDLSTLRLDEVGQFKALTGSQNHDILRKRQHRYRGRIYALNIFTCNGLPILNGTLHGDSAFFDRWEILQFTTKFPPDDAFRMALCSPRMLSSLLNRVLEKMIQIRRDNLLRKSTAEDIKEIWLKSSDPFHLQEFIYANFEGDRAQVVELSKDEIHAAFRRFAEDHNWPVLDKDNLCKRLYNRGFYARYPRTGGKRAHVMTGFKWRTDAPNRLPGEPSQQALDTQNGAGGAT
jgi:phage/plasmid-associated DNA primase